MIELKQGDILRARECEWGSGQATSLKNPKKSSKSSRFFVVTYNFGSKITGLRIILRKYILLKRSFWGSKRVV